MTGPARLLPSRVPEVAIPDQPVADYVLAEAGRRGSAPAIVDGPTGEVVSYRELLARVTAVAGGLQAMGIRRGDVVAVLGANSWQYAVAMYAALRAGAIVTTVNALYTAEEVAGQLRSCRARLVLADPALAPRVAGVPVVGLAGPADPGGRSLADLARSGHRPAEVPIDPATDVALLPYSAGTSGVSKGVMLTHHNLVANMCQTASFMTGLTDRSRVLGLPPFFHIYGAQIILNMTLWAGARVVTVPRFELTRVLSIVERYGIDRVNLAPPVLVALAKDPLVGQYDLSRVEYLFSGAAPLDAELAGQVRERIGAAVRQGYGMTELSPASHAIPDHRDDLPVGSVGLAVPNLTCRVVDPEHGVDVAPGQAGELWCRGPNVMKGYHDAPEATAAAIDADGFLHTGDLVRYDRDGVFTVVGRCKELIKYKGHQVPPAELEALLLRHPDIADVAVVGRPDPAAGEIPVAYVVRRRGAELTAAAVTGFLTGRVAPYKQVRAVRFVPAIPKSTAGKILRHQLP